MNHDRLASWSVVAAGEGRITGLIVDALTVYRSRFQSIGASIYTGVDQPIVSKPRQAPMIFDDVNEFCRLHHLSYLTKATISGVKRLRVRKVDNRCTGLCIHHDEDGFVEVLGQWDPSDGNTILDIYDSSEGPLTALTFRYAEDNPLYSHIADIIVGDRPEANQTFIWRASEDRVCCQEHVRNEDLLTIAQRVISWWFTHIRDHVRPSNGQMVPLELPDSRWRAMSLRR